MRSVLHLFRSPVFVTESEIDDFLQAAITAGSESLGIPAAQRWAQGFRFPPAALAHDEAFLRAHSGNLAQASLARQTSLTGERLSLTRVHQTFGTDGKKIPGVHPRDFENLCIFATTGVPLLRPKNFVRCAQPPPLRTKYLAVAAAVNKLIFDQHTNGTVLLLPRAATLAIPGIHYSPQHWTLKKGKQQGRIICDVANADDNGTTPLNGTPGPDRDELRCRIEATWGPIRHPTLDALMQMILSAVDRYGWENVILWKKDLQGAFNLLWFDADDTALLAFLLSDDVVVLHLAGMFGWAGMPFAFDIVTRVLRSLVRAVIQGLSEMYVDDIQGASSKLTLEADMRAADDAVRGLLGPNAISPSKNEHGRVLDWIGWEVNLDTQRVTLSESNMLRTVYAFFSFDLKAKVSLEQVQRMASLASRCSMLARQMRPYTQSLYDCASRYQTHARAARALTAAARNDVIAWRAFLVAARFDKTHVARPIQSFATRQPTVAIAYDSSLTGFAVGVSVIRDGHSELLAFTALSAPFATTSDSSFQNTYEYLAVVLGILIARHCQLRHFSAVLYGDNMSSLHWALSDRVSSTLAHRANIAFTLAACDIDCLITETVHVPGVDNVVYDGLSRGKTATEVGLDPSKELHLPAAHPIHRFIALCDPLEPLVTLPDRMALSAEFVDLLADPLFYT